MGNVTSSIVDKSHTIRIEKVIDREIEVILNSAPKDVLTPMIFKIIENTGLNNHVLEYEYTRWNYVYSMLATSLHMSEQGEKGLMDLMAGITYEISSGSLQLGRFNLGITYEGLVKKSIEFEETEFFDYTEDIRTFRELVRQITSIIESYTFTCGNIHFQSRHWAHTNVLFIHKTPTQITMVLYEPHGSINDENHHYHIEKLLGSIIQEYNRTHDTSMVLLNRTNVSCLRGLQAKTEETNTSIDTGYCTAYSYLWIYLVIKCIIEIMQNSWLLNTYFNNPNTFELIISSIEKMVIKNQRLNNPTALKRLIVSFATYITNKYIEFINKYYPEQLPLLRTILHDTIVRNLTSKFPRSLKSVSTLHEPTLLIGQNCTLDSQCISGNCIQGRCEPREGLPDNEEIKHREDGGNEDNEDNEDNEGDDLLFDGEDCDDDDQCISRFCHDRKCISRQAYEKKYPGKKVGELCNESFDCESGYCVSRAGRPARCEDLLEPEIRRKRRMDDEEDDKRVKILKKGIDDTPRSFWRRLLDK